jgi:hypothetical protein
MKSVRIDGRLIQVGDRLTSSEESGRLGIPPNREVKVVDISKNRGGGEAAIGVADTRVNRGWHNMDGRLDSGSGYWVNSNELFEYFRPSRLSESVIVKSDFSFRNKNLKGKKGKLLATLPDCEDSMIEFEEYVEGCSCDGLGKAGHCLVVSHSILEFVGAKKMEKGM